MKAEEVIEKMEYNTTSNDHERPSLIKRIRFKRNDEWQEHEERSLA